MREADHLTEAILACPGDDLPRLAYADWLDDNGDPDRAEFIRAECRLAGMLTRRGHAPCEWDRPEYRPLERRAQELWEINAPHWYPGLKVLGRDLGTKRGFPEYAALSVGQFLRHGEALFAAAPTLRGLSLDRLGSNAPALAACPALGRVQKLTFFATPFRAREARQFFASPHLGRLREFEVGFTDTRMGPAGAHALASSPSLTRLTRLDIRNHAVYDAGVGALLRAPALREIESWELGNNGLTDATGTAIHQSGHLGRLRSLGLARNHLTRHGLRLLAASPHLGSLGLLDLAGNPLGPEAPGPLADAPFAPSLHTLRLGGCALGDGGLAQLFRRGFPALRELSLVQERPGEAALAALGEAACLRELEELNLSLCELTPESAGALGRVMTLPALRVLTLRGNPLGAEGVRDLLDGPLADSLTWLDLHGTGLGDAGVEALLAARPLPRLRYLGLWDNGITDRGAARIRRAGAFCAVQSLSLHQNLLGPETRASLAAIFGPDVCRL